MLETKIRTHTCGELTLQDAGKEVTLCGWVFRSRDQGGMVFIDLRDRYGLTQLVFLNPAKTVDGGQLSGISQKMYDDAKALGREYVIKATGKVQERSKNNPNITTGEIEVLVSTLELLNASKTPPFTLEEETDGGDELRMKYRYIDLRRDIVKNNLLNRHKVAKAVREYLDGQGFADIETPFLIKSTPEGARDFVVPSSMNKGEFYALPQSPQTFKQLLMVAGFDRYYQIIRCFRDEDLRADRQPEFTQIDCEMAFVEQEDVLNMFEGMVKHVFRKVRNMELGAFPRMTFADALKYYGNDKPDTRFEILLHEITDVAKGKNFNVIDGAEYVGAIAVPGASEYTRKQTDDLTEFVKRSQIGAKGLIYVKYAMDGTLKSSVDKFYTPEDLKKWADTAEAKPGDLILVVAGDLATSRRALSELRLELGGRLGLRDKKVYKPLWVLDFPLLEADKDTGGWVATHHPFTSWKKEDEHYFETDPGKIRANAYDLVINGVELSSGSIRIHDRAKQEKMFNAIGLTKENYEKKFAFILNAFEYGAPPHGGIAFGFDRFCSICVSNEDYIRDFIAFPKNNAGRDTMIDTPSTLSDEQLKELGLKIDITK
ncbi:MAG TPA: aspartate--tRNA ligase [Bacteroidia bacterium]|nr:aspartate--tRNA ligase [Bacteroidia bacterium]